jgi:DtxR family transcriptional regulator, Mn-dependent transcriptional regulator
MTETIKFSLPGAEQESLEESLGILWRLRETGSLSREEALRGLAGSVGEAAYGKLIERGYVREEGGAPRLTEFGETLARGVTRRHRLAERLLTDVLDMPPAAADPDVCRLEHVLSAEATDSICALLGHPTEDPHGRPIPEGPCCAGRGGPVEPLIRSVDRMKPGEEGTIAYLRLAAHPELHKLLSLGLAPGARIHVRQTRPAFVLQVGESELALDEDVAKNIFVRKV